MIETALRRKRAELARGWEEREAKLKAVRAKERAMEERGRAGKRQRVGGEDDGRKREVDEEREFLIQEWRDDDGGRAGDDPLGMLGRETRELLERVGMGGRKQGDEEEEDGGVEEEVKVCFFWWREVGLVLTRRQIFYTSRTHSQLTQFIAELRRPEFPPSLPDGLVKTGEGEKDGDVKEVVKQLPLSSRQKLCINPSVSRLGSLSAINDRCTELQQGKTKEKCAFMPNPENLKGTHQFRDKVLATLPDIEDMHRIGKEMQVCPYYASRTVIPGAEVITLPYPLLLQESARNALGIKLEGNVVIIDEAHNIMDAVANVYAAEIRLAELRRARQMLGVYAKRFGKKLKGENRVMVAQVGRVVESLSEWLSARLLVKVGADPTFFLAMLELSTDLLSHRATMASQNPTSC